MRHFIHLAYPTVINSIAIPKTEEMISLVPLLKTLLTTLIPDTLVVVLAISGQSSSNQT